MIYSVQREWKIITVIEVAADNEDEAINKAEDLYNGSIIRLDGGIDFDNVYQIDPLSDWAIIDVEEES